MEKNIDLFTDGSCNPNFKIGAWASIIIYNNKEIEISSIEEETTHNRMELCSVIKSIDYIVENISIYNLINIYSDSQYVIGLIDRKDKLKANNFFTKNGNKIQNLDLVKSIIHYIENLNLNFIKVKAHQKKNTGNDYNRRVDKLCRKLVRARVKELTNC